MILELSTECRGKLFIFPLISIEQNKGAGMLDIDSGSICFFFKNRIFCAWVHYNSTGGAIDYFFEKFG